MATITLNYSDRLAYAGTNLVSSIDDEFRNLSTALQERLQNAGFYIPNAAAGVSDGLPFTSPSSKNANTFTVYGKSGSAPDETNKLLVIDSAGAHTMIGNPSITGNVTISGTLTVATFAALTTNSAKRLIVLTNSGNFTTTPNITNMGMIVPDLVTGFTATIKEWGVVADNSLNGYSFNLKKLASPTYTSDLLVTQPSTGTSILNNGTAIAIAAVRYGLRKKSAGDFWNGATTGFQTVSAGDILLTTIPATGSATAGSTYVVIELTYV